MDIQNKNEKKDTVFIIEIIGKVFFSAVLIIMISAAVMFFLLFFMGVQVHCAYDSSMEPEIPENSLVLVSKTDPSVINSGQNITYVTDEQGTLKNGRTVENDSLRERVTVTDNSGNNNEVMWDNIIGTAVYAVPAAGAVYDYIISEENRAVLITIAFLLVGSSLAFEIIIKRIKNK